MRQQRLQEGGRGVVDGRDDGDQPNQVEPAREPAPTGAAELGGPVVDAAGGGERRRELRHREGDGEDQQADHRPADRDRDRTAVVEGHPVGRKAAREYRDDREGDREVGESAPAALELLLVAELCEALLVVAECPGCAHTLAPSRKRFDRPSFGRDNRRDRVRKSIATRQIATAALGRLANAVARYSSAGGRHATARTAISDPAT